MRRHHAELMNQQLQAPGIEHELKEKDHQVQPNQKVVHPGCAVARLVVTNGKHKKSVNLVIEQFYCGRTPGHAVTWKSGASAPRKPSTIFAGFSPRAIVPLPGSPIIQLPNYQILS